MHFIKLSFALLSVGGASYALIKVDQASGWVKFASVVMALAALMLALPELPRAIDGLLASGVKIQRLVASQLPNSGLLNSTPLNSAPPVPVSAPAHSVPQAMPGRSLLDDPAMVQSPGRGLLDGIGPGPAGKAASQP